MLRLGFVILDFDHLLGDLIGINMVSKYVGRVKFFSFGIIEV